MERQIKFRGFGSGKWRYGYYVHFDEKPISEIYNPKFRDFIISQGKYGEHAIPVDPETVGQFTGIYDENGTPIFEGDIIHFSYYDTEYDTGYTKHIVVEEMVKFEYGSFCIKHYPFILDRCFNMNDDDKLVVIGNFYDGKNN